MNKPIDLTDPRARIRVAGAADVCVQTVERYVKSDGKGVRASSARRIREALATFEQQAESRAATR